MQHGNSASSLKPLHVFQVTGKLLKGLNDLVVYSIQLNFKPTSVKLFAFNKEAIKSCVTDSIGSISVLLLLAIAPILVYYTTQRFCISKVFLLKQKNLCHINIRKCRITNESRYNKLLDHINLRNFHGIASCPLGLLECESNSLIRQRR